jgi:hypothetical protein
MNGAKTTIGAAEITEPRTTKNPIQPRPPALAAVSRKAVNW